MVRVPAYVHARDLARQTGDQGDLACHVSSPGRCLRFNAWASASTVFVSQIICFWIEEESDREYEACSLLPWHLERDISMGVARQWGKFECCQTAPFSICHGPRCKVPLQWHLVDVPTVDDHGWQSDKARPKCFFFSDVKACAEGETNMVVRSVMLRSNENVR